MSNVGLRIKSARLQKGMTQEELGKAVGVQKSAVAKWENGRVSEIKRSNLKKLADALDMKPSDLFDDIHSDPVGTANVLADVYENTDLNNMIKEYLTLDARKQEQIREYVHLLSIN